MNKTPEEILKEKYDHHKTVVNPDGNWASWESCVEDGSIQVAIDAINEYHNQFVQDTVSNCQVFLDSSIQQEQQDWISKLLEYEFFRIENDESGFYISIIDRKKYPRVWADNFNDQNTIIAESVDNQLNRTTIGDADWIKRFSGETFEEAFKEFYQWSKPTQPS